MLEKIKLSNEKSLNEMETLTLKLKEVGLLDKFFSSHAFMHSLCGQEKLWKTVIKGSEEMSGNVTET